MDDLLDITDKAQPVTLDGPEGLGAVTGFTDGRNFYFDEKILTRIAAHLTGLRDLAGRMVRIQRWAGVWQEQRGGSVPQVLRRRNIRGVPVYHLDDEWIFTVRDSGVDGRQFSSG